MQLSTEAWDGFVEDGGVIGWLIDRSSHVVHLIREESSYDRKIDALEVNETNRLPPRPRWEKDRTRTTNEQML